MQEEKYKNTKAKKVTFIGFIVNIFLSLIKIIGGIAGKSAALIADGVHSFSDFIIDIAVLITLKFSIKPRDECHNYGHEKIQTVISAAIGVFLIVLAFQFLKSGITNIIDIIGGLRPEAPRVYLVIIIALNIIIKGIMYRYILVTGQKTGNFALVANAKHCKADVLSSIGILLGVGGAALIGNFFVILDPIASIIVSLMILKAAIDIIKPAYHELIERAVSEEDLRAIKSILEGNPNVLEYHKLRTRKLGNTLAADMHILVDSCLSIEEAHNISKDIEIEIKTRWGNKTLINIHIEPYQIK